MITVSRKDTTVCLEVQTALPINKPILLFQWKCDKELHAALLERHLRTRLHNMVSAIRKESYFNGYGDGRHHQEKREYFEGTLE